MRELVYLSRAKLDAFVPRRRIFSRTRPEKVEVSLPGLTVGATAPDQSNASAVPWDRLRAVENHLRKTAARLDSRDLRPGLWFRFHQPMVWTVGAVFDMDRYGAALSNLVLFASDATDPQPDAPPPARILLCGSRGHLIGDRSQTSVRWDHSSGAWVTTLHRWVADSEQALDRGETPEDPQWSSHRWNEIVLTVHRGTVAKAPDAPADVCGYARVLRCNVLNEEHREGRLILATPLVVEYASASDR